MMKKHLFALLIWAVSGVVTQAAVVTVPLQKLPEGQLEAYYADGSVCESIVFIHVGTAMRVGNYEDLGKAVAQQDTVALIIDSNPGNPLKQDGEKFTNLVNAISEKLSTLVECCTKQPKYNLIGGHSGGGQAAVEALQTMDEITFTPTGFVGLAPYEISSDLAIHIPSLDIGFSKMSCLVQPSKAALAAYLNSDSDHRVFYQLQTHNLNVVTGGPHCSFADNGCAGGLFCPGDSIKEWMHSFVGQTVQLFLEAIVSNTFNYNHFLRAVPTTGKEKVDLFVNADSPVKSKQRALVASPPAPKWPNQWSADFYTEYWGNLGWRRSRNKGSYHYDWTNGQSLEQHGAGQQDNWCGCASKESDDCRILAYTAANPNNYQGQAATYAQVGDVCCLLFVGIGPLEPTWLMDSPDIQYSGESKAGHPKRSCYGWENTKPGNALLMTGDLWLIDQNQIPCGYKDIFKWWAKLLGLGHYFTFDESTYTLTAGNVFDLSGSDCHKACPNRDDKSKQWCKSTWSGP